MEKANLNYIINIGLLISGLTAIITGIMKLPAIGLYHTRNYWSVSAVHDWSGIIFALLILIHVILHWNWLVAMTKNQFTKSKSAK